MSLLQVAEFNPVEHLVQMKIIGFGLTITGVLLLILTAILGTRMSGRRRG